MPSLSEQITNALKEKLDADVTELLDESAKHAGHRGNVSGGAHFVAVIVSPKFEGRSLIERHRIVYDALGDLMKKDVHAFTMKTYTPKEWSAK